MAAVVHRVDGVGDAVAIVFGSLFGVGILGAFMRRWWAQQDNAFAADQNARIEERASCDEQIERVRAECRAHTDQLREDHEDEVAEIRASFDRRFAAMAVALRGIVAIVPEGELRREATDILLNLSIDEGGS